MYKPHMTNESIAYEEQRDRLRTFLAGLSPGARVWYSDPSVPSEPTCASVSGWIMDRRGKARVGRLLRRLGLERLEIEDGRAFVMMSTDDYSAHVYRATSRTAAAVRRAREVAESATRLPDMPGAEVAKLRTFAAGMGLLEETARGAYDPPPVRRPELKLIKR